jgi:hypothetical protein
MEYYTYAYLREDRTPYYIGKGKCDRAYRKNRKNGKPPTDKSRILILKQNLTEEEAFKHEIYMIAVFGRKDLRTGILHNRTNGGDGTSGHKMSEIGKNKLSNLKKGVKLPESHIKNIAKSVKKRWEDPEYKEKMSLLHKGKKKSEEHKKKIGEANRGKSVNKGAFSKVWEITYENGNVEIVYEGLSLWCEKNGYSCSKIRDLSRGAAKKSSGLVSVREVSQGKWQRPLDAL